MKGTFGESFTGTDYLLLNIPLHFPINDNNNNERFQECKVRHSNSEIDILRAAIQDDYWYKLSIDGLPVWGALGVLGKDPDNGNLEEYIYTHRHFEIGYNGKHIVEASLNTSEPRLLSDYVLKNKKYGLTMNMTYSVSWKRSDILPEERTDVYREPEFFEHQGHFLALTNSLMLALFLAGVVVIILTRTRQNDVKLLGDFEESEGIVMKKSHKRTRSHHSVHEKQHNNENNILINSDNNVSDKKNDNEDDGNVVVDDNNGKSDLVDEPRWKEGSKEIRYAPQHSVLFSALVGSGAHFLATLILLCVYGILSREKYFYKGSFAKCAILFYAVTSDFGGIFSCWCYKRHNNGQGWARPCILTVLLYPGLFAAMWAILNFIASVFSSSMAAPLTTHLALFVIWAILIVPFTTVGSIFSNIVFKKSLFGNSKIHRRGNSSSSSSKNTKVQYHRNKETFNYNYSTLFNIAIWSGVTFASIISELYFVYSALWKYKMYYTYGYALFTLVCLVVIAGCAASISVYRCLGTGEYRWHWVAFLTGATTGVYVAAYSVVYFSQNAGWSLLSWWAFCMVTVTLAVALGLLCGFSGYVFSAVFVRKLYISEKAE